MYSLLGVSTLRLYHSICPLATGIVDDRTTPIRSSLCTLGAGPSSPLVLREDVVSYFFLDGLWGAPPTEASFSLSSHLKDSICLLVDPSRSRTTVGEVKSAFRACVYGVEPTLELRWAQQCVEWSLMQPLLRFLLLPCLFPALDILEAGDAQGYGCSVRGN